jgi:hypothetical protein
MEVQSYKADNERLMREKIQINSRVLQRLNQLQRQMKKGTKFEWTLKCEKNFNLLKELLTSALVLKIVDPNESFVVCTDACKE